MAKPVVQAHPVGIDDGRAFVKIYAGKGRQLKIRSSVKAGLSAGSSNLSGAGDMESGSYKTEGRFFTVGDRVDGEDTRFEDYDGSDINRVAIHHALVRAGFSGKEVSIATGLPVSSYYLNSKLNTKNIEAKRGGISLPVESLTAERRTASIVKNIVVSEALAAWFDDVLDEDGSVRKGADTVNPCGVVDFGGRTIDCMWINPPDQINHARSGSEEIGVLNLFDLVETAIEEKYDVSNVSRSMLEMAITTRQIKLFGELVSVKEIVDGAAEEIGDRISREIQRRFGSAAELDRILFVGGGVAAIPQIAKRYKNAVLVREPEFANARGMYKFLRNLKG